MPTRSPLVAGRLAHLLASVLGGVGLCLAVVSGLAARSVHAAAPAAGIATIITYTSSIDGYSLRYSEYLPANYRSAVSYPVVVMLPGSGGVIHQYDYDLSLWPPAVDAHGYILATVEPRHLPGFPSSRQTFYIDGPLLPAEQDVLDVLPILAARHLIDNHRIYVAGYSMGGMGSFKLAATRPGIFAAAAPGATASDLLQESSYLTGMAAPSLATVLGGNPGQSVLTDTYWLENSPRFLIGNLMHTAVYIVHGTTDTLLPNDTAIAPYMQSRHVVDVPGFVDSRGRATTLDELAALWAGDFIEQHLWPPTNHGGTQAYWLPDDVLTFFDQHPLVDHPLDVAFTTFDDRHTRAYWLQLDLVHPWTATPGSVIVSRMPATNMLRVQALGSLTVTLDLPAMALTTTAPLKVIMQPISAAVASDVALVLTGAWPAAGSFSVMRDGLALPPNAYTATNSALTLRRQPVTAPHTYVIASGPVAPSLVGPSAAFGLVGAPFSLTLSAAGSQPITYTAAPLPAGLALVGATLNGTPRQAGVTTATIGAHNAAGQDSKQLVITISDVLAKVYLPLMRR